MSTEAAFLKVEGLAKRYGESIVFDSVNFGIRKASSSASSATAAAARRRS